MSSIIESLYQEYMRLIEQYKDTVSRLNAIAHSINQYGGEVPNTDDIELQNITSIQAMVRESMYPYDGTWGDKIIYVLKRLNKPSTATEIVEYMRSIDKIHFNSTNLANTSNTIAATCSRLAKEGEIGLDASQKKNLYYILP